MTTGMRGTRRPPGRRVEHEPFPAIPLKDVAAMARVIDAHGGRCRFDELADALGQTKGSGAFRQKTAAGRMFGVAETEGSNLILTGLGRRLSSPSAEAEALVEAFLHVRLYASLYDRYAAEGGKLPSNEVIQDDMIRLDVPTHNAQRARQVFLRSAEDAGFFRSGRDRLIQPNVARGGSIPSMHGITPEPREPAVSMRGEAAPVMAEPLRIQDLPSLMQGLVAKLPPEGERFTPRQRELWLDAAKRILDFVYAGDDEASGQAASLNGAASVPVRPS
jgi:hypothetical protein